jgi:hypothetical protein
MVRASGWAMVALLMGCGSQGPHEDAGGESSLSLERATWTLVIPGAVATSRAHHLFVYDEARVASVIFGGRPLDDSGPSLADTGEWNGTTWTRVESTLARRGYVAGAFDSARERVVVYGGADVVAGANVYYDDTWELDGAAWSRRETAGAPGKRSSYGLAYDRQRAVTVMFGGYNAGWKGDLWEWDGSSWKAKCNTAPCATAPRPSARANPVFVYDQARKVALLFGGFGNGTSYSDTWTWDGEVWRKLSPARAPSGRDSAAATYDPVSERVLLFGGVQGTGQGSDELWAWDGVDWTRISATTPPAARQGAGFAWDVARGRGVLFGGRPETDAWELSLTQNACSASADCADGVCVDGTCSSAGAMGGAPTSGGLNGAGASSGSRATGGSGDADGGDNTLPGEGSPPGGEGGAPSSVEPPRATAGEASAGALGDAKSFYSCSFSAPARNQGLLTLLGLGAALFACGRRRRTTTWRPARPHSAPSRRGG